MNFDFGSTWRKWDLHVHTPNSQLNNQFGGDWDKYIYELFKKALEEDVAAIGITDYFSIDGYKTVLKYLNDDNKLKEIFKNEIQKCDNYLTQIKNILIFPNIELRLSNTVVIEGKNTKRLQFHILFDNKVNIEDIEDNFLRILTFRAECNADGQSIRSLTKSNITRVGEEIKKVQKDGFDNLSDYEAGLKIANISIDDIEKALSNSLFTNKYLKILAQDDLEKIKWSDQGHLTRKRLLSFADGMFSSNKKTINWGLAESTKNEFVTLKPCLWGSDAHAYEKLFLPDNNNFCWIKADLTFEGLKQVFVMPNERVYIGAINPMDQVYNRKSNIVLSIDVKKRNDAKNSQVWFDSKLILNPFMTTIIGNKGSGKSALADIIAYTLNSKNIEYASFLNTSRFQKNDHKYAQDYTASVQWLDNRFNTIENLQIPKNEIKTELVKYLPQKYIELACNELGDEFQKEIDKVIFSYINDANKGKFSNIYELLDEKLMTQNLTLQQLRIKLENINKTIISLEDKKTSYYKSNIVQKLASFKEKLSIHLRNKPAIIEKPNDEQSKIHASQLSLLNSMEESLEKEIENINGQLLIINSQLQKIETFESNNLQVLSQIDNINKEYIILLSEIRLDSKEDKYFKIQVNNKELMEYRIKLVNHQQELNKLVDDFEVVFDSIKVQLPESIDENTIKSQLKEYPSLISQKYVISEIKRLVTEQSDLSIQKYQGFLSDYKTWDITRKQIIGEISSEENIDKYEKELSYLENVLDKDLENAKANRIKIISDIFDVYIYYVEVYKNTLTPIQNRLTALLKNMNDIISFDVNIMPANSLKNEILATVDKRATGFYQGASKSSIALDTLIKDTDFNTKESVLNFVTSLYDNACGDFDNIKLILGDRREFYYEYVGTLKYLRVNYILKSGNKFLDQLSPGEKGIVLLAFYLALDKDNSPLIIDQPEDNLDNQSVYNNLVPCIIEAKKNRQLIVVTHNPNIAIACDSEQIIYCHMEKQLEKISYISGSIENNTMKNKVVDILEGTQPAFDLRKDKYKI